MSGGHCEYKQATRYVSAHAAAMALKSVKRTRRVDGAKSLATLEDTAGDTSGEIE